MIVSKVAGVLLVTALAVALSRLPSRPRPRFNSLSRRLMRLNHFHLLPSDVSSSDGETFEYREPCNQASETAEETPVVPKRSGEHAIRFETPSCVCPEVQGAYNLGPGHWPRYIAGRECKRSEGKTNLDHEISSTCDFQHTQIPEGASVRCEHKIYPVFVLTRRNAQISEIESNADQSFIPVELQAEWTFKLFNISVACQPVKN